MAAFKPVPKHTAITLLDEEAFDLIQALTTYVAEFQATEAVQAFLAGLIGNVTFDVPGHDPNGEVAADDDSTAAA